MFGFIQQPWPWYLAGHIIGLTVTEGQKNWLWDGRRRVKGDTGNARLDTRQIKRQECKNKIYFAGKV